MQVWYSRHADDDEYDEVGTYGLRMTMDDNDNNDDRVLHDEGDTDAADIADTVST